MTGWKFNAKTARLRAFAGDRAGAILPLFAIVLVFVIVAAGAGIDFARAVNQRQSLARGLDAAMLAVARELSIRNMSEGEIRSFLDENYAAYFGANGEGSGVTGATVTIEEPQINTQTRQIAVAASASVPTFFIGLGGLGPEKLDVSVNAQAIYPKSVEAALVLDVTGSMAGSKIRALRDAASAFVNTLVPPDSADDNEKVRIAVIPYASGVNIGTTRATKATGGWNKSRKSFEYCVSERTGAQAYTDDSYTTAVVGPGSVRAGYKKGSYFDGRKILERSSMVCPDAELVPLSLDPGSKAKNGSILNTIDKLRASGQTVGQSGIAWGWYTLSSNWSGLWPASARPAPYSDERVLKYMLLMTDGAFNTYFTPLRFKRKNYDWLMRGSTQESTNRAIRLCKEVKDSGIKIITVGFQIGGNSNAKKVMEECASTPSDYYLADDDAELIERFAAIANQIKTTYLAR
jgi:Flp pilus assembly protein TadG